MRLQYVSAATGATWVRRGFQAFARQPLAFSGLFAAFLFFVFVLTLVSVIGPLLLLALLPLGSLGFMIATKQSLGGQLPLPRVFFEPLRHGAQRSRDMLMLGVAYAVASVAIIALSEWADGGALEALMDVVADGKATPEEVAQRLADGQLQLGVAMRLGLAGLLSVPFWHAPALVHWGAQGVAQSLFSSTVAMWRNKGAFVVFSLAWLGVVLSLGVAANLIAALLGQAQLVTLLAMPASLLLSTVFYTSLYFTFADCFVDGDEASSSTPPTDAAPQPPESTP